MLKSASQLPSQLWRLPSRFLTPSDTTTKTMASPKYDIRKIMVLVPLEDPLLARLKQHFKQVYYYPEFMNAFVGPGKVGPDKDAASTLFESVPKEEWETTELMLLASIPRQLTNRAKQLPNLRWIQIVSAGVDFLFKSDLIKNEPKDTDLLITTASGIHALSISQHVFMLVLSLYHSLQQFIIAANEDKWVPRSQIPNGGRFIPDLRGQTIGILGYGGIGREVGRVAHAWGLEVLACNSTGERKPETSYVIDGTGDPEGKLPKAWYKSSDPKSLKEFLSASDIIVLAAPSSPATYHILNATGLSQMKTTAVLINVSRGTLVDQEALIEALNNGTIGGAGLDVATPEPLPPGHPLFHAKNCVITPHVSGDNVKYMQRVLDVVEANAQKLKDGERLYNLVNLSRGY